MWGTCHRGWRDRPTKKSCFHEGDVRGDRAVPAASAVVVAARCTFCAEIGPSLSTSMLSSLSVSVSGSTSLLGLVLALFSQYDPPDGVGERFVSVLGRCARTLVRMALLVRTWLRGEL